MNDSNLSTECYAIDTWQGDMHSGFYSNEVFDTVSNAIQKHYSTIDKMLRTSFDDAIQNFEDEGIVLIHYTEVRFQDFGVHIFGDQLKQQYPHFEFKHPHGLSVFFP